MKKNLLYIGLSSHRKTRSTVFLQDLLRAKYDVTCLDVGEPMQDISSEKLNSLVRREFEVLVIFQVWLDIPRLKRQIKFKHGVWFPMYDGLPEDGHSFFSEIVDFNIISFSLLVHENLMRRGFTSHYIQYFPQPSEQPFFGEGSSVYLWQRRKEVNLQVLESLFRGRTVDRIHLHKVLDPGHAFTGIPESLANRVEVSTWYDTRAEMLEDQRKCAYYLAPRLCEGIGMGFLEAMAMGKCVIAANNPTFNEYIVNGVNGLLFDEHDVQPIRCELSLREMQQNAYDSCCIGYKLWMKRRWKILEWCDSPVPARPHVVKPADLAGISTRDVVRLVAWRMARRVFLLLPHPIRLFVNRIVGRSA